MDYEKKYNDALNLAKSYYGNGCNEFLDTIFPELRESEDERIRKLLVWQVYRNIEDETNDLAQSVYDGIKGHDPDLEESIEDWKRCLAYLEKQKEEEGYEAIPVESTLEYKLGFHAGKEAQWRPNDEQIHALERTIRLSNFGCEKERRNALSSLLEQLRQLNSPSETHKQELFEKQKEQKPLITGNDFGWIDELKHDLKHPEELDEKVQEVLKKRQKPTEWSEEDNIGWDEAFACVTRAEKAAKNEEELQNAVTAEKWLKELKFKYCVHPVKQEWSEEDDQLLGFIFDLLNDLVWRKDWAMSKEECLERLKSLRPRPSWKPSEEQMQALKRASTNEYISAKQFDILVSLYEQLKKLGVKEEPEYYQHFDPDC